MNYSPILSFRIRGRPIVNPVNGEDSTIAR